MRAWKARLVVNIENERKYEFRVLQTDELNTFYKNK